MYKQPKSEVLVVTIVLGMLGGGSPFGSAEDEKSGTLRPGFVAHRETAGWRAPMHFSIETASGIEPLSTIVGTAQIHPPSIVPSSAAAQSNVHNVDSLRKRFSEHPRDVVFTTMGVGMFAASAGDLATTELRLAERGMVELNPLQTNRFARVAAHAAVPAFLWWVTDRFHDRGKRKLAIIVRVGFTLAYGYVALHNMRTTTDYP